MTETKQLKDEELKQVSGGTEAPDGRKPKYSKGDVVEYFNGRILEILDVVCWMDEDNGFVYNTIIRESEETSGRFSPGHQVHVYEKLIVQKKYGV